MTVSRVGSRSAVAGLLGALLLAGCTDTTAEDANEVDRDRLRAVLADPWLAASDGEIARLTFGSNRGYHPGEVTTSRSVPRDVGEVARMEVAAAGKAGWWPTYGRCPTAPGRTADEEPDAPDPDAVVVHLVRELPDGSFAQAMAELTVPEDDDEDEDGDAGAGVRTRVRVVATVAHHLQPAPSRPPEVDVTDLECLAATDAAVPGPVGDPEPLNLPGQQPGASR